MDYYDELKRTALGGSGGGGGTSNYEELQNKPAIGGITLIGNKSLAQLGIQPEIEDLTTIRSGASAGATAVQPATMETALAGKQDTIADLSDIRTGAGKGATAVQTISINGTAQTKTDGAVDLPAYPTTLPASDTVDTYSASGTEPVSGKAVAAALGALDVSEVGGSGKVITTISETDGKILATAVTMDTTPTADSTNPITSGGVAASQAEQDALIAGKADVSQVFGQGIALKATDDCNNITEVGMYCALSSSNVPASNSPFTNAGFRMRVEKWYQAISGVTGIIQIADTYLSNTTYAEKRRIYFYTGGGVGWRWTDWATTISVAMTVPED